MRILLTNDDGYHAPGLQTLYAALSTDQRYALAISAPERQQSAKGHSITLFDPIFVDEYTLEHGAKGFSVRGTPSDSVKLAIQGKLTERPDLLISGINRGFNLGTDVYYSGTVSAAMEGVFLGI
ncbi:MAG: 5'/3'-nucleotidase SurE, partial [Peptococcaceae bacterium]|nr:5'/3'-nucleotidase SurE [Peptococcaceae bacterium]